jgi:hypothetical protein
VPPARLLYPTLDLIDVEHSEVQLVDRAGFGQPDRPIPVAIRWSQSGAARATMMAFPPRESR